MGRAADVSALIIPVMLGAASIAFRSTLRGLDVPLLAEADIGGGWPAHPRKYAVINLNIVRDWTRLRRNFRRVHKSGKKCAHVHHHDESVS